MKFCKKCKIEKPESEFTKKASSEDGLYCWCRECSRIYQKIIDSKPDSKKKKQEYYLQNKETILERGSEYRKTHRPLMNEHQRKYLKTAKGKATDSRKEHKFRMKFRKGKSDLTARQWGNIITLQNNRCSLCGEQFTLDRQPTKDCIIPISAGGHFTYGNVQALCFTCNMKKGRYNPIPDLFNFLF